MNTKKHQKKQIGKIEEDEKIAYSNKNALVKRMLLGIGLTNEKEESILEFVKESLQNTRDNYYIVTPNPEMIVYSKKSSVFRSLLNNAQIALCDGVGLVWAGKILGVSFKQRVSGVDFMKKLCAAGKDWPITVGFLGGRGDVAKKTAECLIQECPGLQVVFAASDWPEENEEKIRTGRQHMVAFIADKEGGIDQQNNSNNQHYGTEKPIDILFVAYGFPKQEEWMAKHLNKIPVRIMMGVGGAFDYVSGQIPRAPKFLRVIGLEWLFRLIRQPWRWRRQLALITFMRFVFVEKFTR